MTEFRRAWRETRASRPRGARWCALGIASLLAIAAWSSVVRGQDPVGPAEIVEVRLIEIAVTATGRDGIPIDDLDPGEIEITLPQSRKRREKDTAPVLALAGLRRVESDQPFTHEQVRLTIETGATSATFVSGEDEPRYVVFLLDVANMESSQHDKVRRDLQTFVRDRIGPQDVAAVLSFNGQLNFEAPFHSDPEFLAQAIERAFARSVPVAESTTRRMRTLERELRACEYVSDNPFTRTEGGSDDALLSDDAIAPDNPCVRGTVEHYVRASDSRAVGLSSAFLAAVRLVSGVREEATVYAVTPGLSVSPTAEVVEAVSGIFGRTLSARMASTFAVADRGARVLEDAITVARSNRVVVHVIDPSVGSDDSKSASRRTASVGGASPTDVARESARAAVGRVANATGGRFVSDAPVADGLAVASDTGRGRYLLHVMTDTTLDPERIARIRIGSSRRSVEIRAVDGGDVGTRIELSRHGSIVIDTPRTDSVNDPESSPRTTWPFSVSVPAAALGYQETERAWVAELTLHVLVQTETGRELVGSYAFLQHAIPTGEWATRRNQPVTVRGAVDAPAGEYRLIAVVRNVSSGASAEMIETLSISAATGR